MSTTNEIPQRRIKRKSLQARITHAVVAITCVLLAISGLFVFVPALTQMAPTSVVRAMRMSHKIAGLIFVIIPIGSAILKPSGFKHMFSEMFKPWDKDDREFMIKFVPYMLNPKKVHMPDQHETKSGQRFADGMLVFAGIAIGITGVIMLLGTTVATVPQSVLGVSRFIHDIAFFVLVVFGIAHIYLGAGIFQPYRKTANIMWGDGTVSESDALYHWGHWARKEIEEGKDVVETKE